jgi:hypothetical protein
MHSENKITKFVLKKCRKISNNILHENADLRKSAL